MVLTMGRVDRGRPDIVSQGRSRKIKYGHDIDALLQISGIAWR